MKKLFSDQKKNNTTKFVVSNYPKKIVSMPRSESGTSRPLRNFTSVYVPAPTINSWENFLKIFPYPYGHALVSPPKYGRFGFFSNNVGRMYQHIC
jgi:hypothetical protein